MAPMIEKLVGNHITDEMISQAATLFSSHYGVWGSVAAEKMGKKEGSRITISPRKLKADILPPLPFGAQHILIRALLSNTNSPIAHAFATRYLHNRRPVLWITQLVVHSSHRNQGIATSLLRNLKEEYEHDGIMVGVLSSSPFTIAAVLRVFGDGIEKAEETLDKTRRWAGEVIASCPVSYIKSSKLRGSVFESGEDENEAAVVSCADTAFWIDHQEPERAARVLEEKGVNWPLGKLPEGCEFLVLVDVQVKRIDRIEPPMMQGYQLNPVIMGGVLGSPGS